MVLGVYKWSKSSAVLREVVQLPLANRMEAKQARVTAKLLMNSDHTLHDELTGKLAIRWPPRLPKTLKEQFVSSFKKLGQQ